MLTRYNSVLNNQNQTRIPEKYAFNLPIQNDGSMISENYTLNSIRMNKKSVSQLQTRHLINNNQQNMFHNSSLEKLPSNHTMPLRRQHFLVNTDYSRANSADDSTITSDASSTYSSTTTSSAASIKTIEEEVDNLNDLLYAIRKRIDNIETNYSVDSLYNCMKHHLKHSGYSNFTLSFLEKYRRKVATKSTFKMIIDDDIHTLKSNTLRNSMSPDTLKSIMAPVKQLFKHLSFLKRIYQIIQRDLIFNVLVKSLPNNESMQIPKLTKMNSSTTITDNATIITNSDTSRQQGFGKKKSHLDLNYETGRFTMQSRISMSNNKNLKRLNKYHQILYDLNEKVSLLLNDKDNSDLKLLSNQTKLTPKYDYFKCGEYILRLIPDIIYKIKLILKLCQKSYELSDKFNINTNELMSLKNGTNFNSISNVNGFTNTMNSFNGSNNNIQNKLAQNRNSIVNSTVLPVNALVKENSKISDYEYINRDEIKFAINKRQQSILNKNNKLPIIKENRLINNNNSPPKVQQQQHQHYKQQQHQQQQQQQQQQQYYVAPLQAQYQTVKNFKHDHGHTADLIPETDSSILSDDSNDNMYENYKSKTPNSKINHLNSKPNKTILKKAYIVKPLPQVQATETTILTEAYQQNKLLPPILITTTTKTSTTTQAPVVVSNGAVNKDYNELVVVDKKNRDELYEEYLRKKDEIAECELLIDELRDNLKTLIDRTERCATIKDKINSVINVIRETELHISKTDDDQQDVKSVLQKELNLLKYRLNLLTQDLDVEEVIKGELTDAIQETDRKLTKAQNYHFDLNQQLYKLDQEIKILYKEFF